jgi:hypothetical protein
MAGPECVSSIGTTTATKRLAAGAYDTLIEALSVTFWNKAPFERFLRVALRDHPELLARVTFSATKRQVAGELVTTMAQQEDRYQAAPIALMLEIAATEEFPNLERQEDSATLVANAKAAVESLRKWTAQYSSIVQAQETLRREQQEQKATYEARRSHDRVLAELKQQFLAMHSDSNAQARGRSFERWLNELFFL